MDYMKETKEISAEDVYKRQQEIAFTEFDFYQRYEESFKTSELGRIKSLLPLREMAISLSLIHICLLQ